MIWSTGISIATGFETMARKIFYARRSKRPIIIAAGLMALSIGTFYVGFEAGRSSPDMFAWNAAETVIVAGR
tara:strand:+ start:9998 stop:10213 length:216 start_codon:yes stop_codon:yes gene_type:complete